MIFPAFIIIAIKNPDCGFWHGRHGLFISMPDSFTAAHMMTLVCLSYGKDMIIFSGQERIMW
jgi:hypothetical protein